MRARNKILLSAVMMTMLSSTVAIPNTWAIAGVGTNGRIFAVGADSKFESTGDTTAAGVGATDGGQIHIATLDTPNQDKLMKRYKQPAFITGMLDNSSIQVDGGVMNVNTAPWDAPYPVAFAYNSKINLGIDDAGTVKHKVFNMQGNVLVSDKTMPPYQQQQPSVINIGLGRAHNSPNQFTGKTVNTLEDKGGEINMTFDGGMWSHDNMGGLEAFQIEGKTARSSINTLKGTRTREGFSRISQDSRSDIHVNNLDGHINVIYDMSTGTGLNFAKPPAQKTGIDASDIEGGNFIVKSATTGSGVHGYVTGDQLDTSSESNVNKILDNLAHKFYYENYMNGERNLSGTVSIASNGIVSSFQKALTTDQKEGAITWQGTNGQGSYAAPTPTPSPVTPVTPVTPAPTPITPGAYDTPQMRGIRSAVVGNINAWRTMRNDMNRTNQLQQGAPIGIWAHIGGGRYNYSNDGINTATDYTSIQGGYDTKTSRDWTVGGQVSYLRGSEDYVFNGSGKVKSYAVGAYGLKDLGKDQYVQINSQVGRISNEFTARNEIGQAKSGDVKSNAYSFGVRYGKTIKSDNGFYVEPQAQLNYTHFGGRDFTAGNVSINQAGVNSTSGKLGLEVGKQFSNGNLYTRLAAGHAFTGNVKTTYASGNAVKLTEQDLKGTWTELAFGGRYGFNTNNSVYADVTTGLSGDYQSDWDVNAGFTHKF